MPTLHPQSSTIWERLNRARIEALYHFTNVMNLRSICETEAICSKLTLESLGRRPFVYGGNELSHSLDRRHGNWDKVSLSLTPFTPMVYHKKRASHLCFLVIRPEVATWLGTIFTDTNATNNDQRRAEGLNGLSLIDFREINATPRPQDVNWKRKVQAEILVLDRIPLAYVSEIAFVSQSSMTNAERLCQFLNHPKFVVKQKLFSDSHIRDNVDFPHIISFTLTSEEIDSDTCSNEYTHKEVFYRGLDQRITWIALVQATAGTKATITWNPINKPGTHMFSKHSAFYNWSYISLDDLPNGRCSVEYRLDNDWWTSTDFEVRDGEPYDSDAPF